MPRVNITSQTAEDDDITAAEIQELVRNTSLAGSVDSSITDGAAPGTHGLIGRRMSVQEEEDVRLHAPAVTRERLRSIASTNSGISGGRSSGLGDRPRSSVDQTPKLDESQLSNPKISFDKPSGPPANGEHRQSGAQKFAAAQAARKQSTASGEAPAPNSNVLVEAPHDPNMLVPAPPTKTAQDAANQQRRRSTSVTAKRQASINALYGEPSVRIQLGTKMTFYCRMNIPSSMVPSREIQVIVTELSRPDDATEEFSAAKLGANPDSALSRAKTHTLGKSGVYRIVWTLSTPYSGMSHPPKFLLQAQRVHEIRTVVRGDGKEECVYEDWECQKGQLAKVVKNKYAAYLEKRFEEWGRGLKAYCEVMGGDVERKDFVQ